MTSEELRAALAAPFDPEDVKFKAQMVTGARALAVAYIDARAVMDRLDDVLGVEGWQDDYEPLPDGSAICRLKVRLGPGGEWVTKTDVGGESEQPDGGDRRKASLSDALKRAAVKLGVGRYLYRLPAQWVEYDPQKRRLAREPELPAWALPRRRPAAAAPAAAAPAPAPEAHAGEKAGPATGPEMLAWLHARDAKLAAEGLCAPGDLVRVVTRDAVRTGQPADPSAWAPPYAWAGQLVRQFEQAAREARQPVTGAEVAALLALLGRKGYRWEEARAWLGLAADALPGQLTRAQLATLEGRVAPVPDVEEEKAAPRKAARAGK